MDTLTHIAIGACMGEAFAGRTVGRKAAVWGLLAQSIPDVDFLAVFWTDTSGNLLAHRGFTHSILFAIIISFVMATLAEKWHRPHNISYTHWFVFFASAIFGHIFLDAFNNYGVGWFEPFNHVRVSFNMLYVADPFFSIAPGIAFIMLVLVKKKSKKRIFWWKFGLSISAVYFLYCAVNKLIINKQVEKVLAKQEIKYTHYFTTPAPLQNWLWFVVAGNDSGYYVGYRSVFDHSQKMDLEYFPRNTFLLDTLINHNDVKNLIRFSQEYYTVEKRQDTLVFNDLRFGQVVGWQNPKEEFAFHYYLHPDIDNTLVVQRGRFAKWNKESVMALINRIKGN